MYCKICWLRDNKILNDNPDLPIKRQDMTDHYHQQAKQAMNIIIVVQMEKFGTTHFHPLILYKLHSSRFWKWLFRLVLLEQYFGNH